MMMVNMMGHSSALVAILLSLLVAIASAARPRTEDWINTSVVRTVELAGTVTHSNTVYSITRGTGSETTAAAAEYHFALPASEAQALSWIEVHQAGSKEALQVRDAGPDPSSPDTHLYVVHLPTSAGAKSPVVLTLNTVYTHVTEPLPKSVGQKDSQSLVWQGDAMVRSPYVTKGTSRVKVRCPAPRILSYTPREGTTKSGSTLTFGPHDRVEPYSSSSPERARVHYQHDAPVVSVVELERHVEVSHWGDNLATEDKIWLRNDGPQLKGHFSRIEHQMQAFFAKSNSHVLTSLALHLPPGSTDAYFIDIIGNVSTSHFRPSPPAPESISAPLHVGAGARAASVLDVQPRYPLLGGWNYTFSVGWNNKLGEGGWGRKDEQSGANAYIVAVPFLTPITDVAVDKARTRIVLPEGATNIDVYAPFEMDSISHDVYTTYLDTVGRPAVTLARKRCSEKHAQLIYVRYTLTPTAHLRKPLAIMTVCMALFGLAFVVRRFDPRIKA